MEERARREAFPIIGPQVGRIISLLTASLGARRVLELGSGFGYSALWFAHGMGLFPRPEGFSPAGRGNGDGPGPTAAQAEIHCTDTDPTLAESAASYFEEAGISRYIEFHVAGALELAAHLLENDAEPFDIVFNDVDKDDYPRVPELAHRLLRDGGLLISDNTLWYGLVADRTAADLSTTAIQTYNKSMAEHPRYRTIILPVRDGVTVSQKIEGGTQHG
jgi:predicted O-methyltransferase YrrM